MIRTLDAVKKKIGWLARGGSEVCFCKWSICSRFRFTDAHIASRATQGSGKMSMSANFVFPAGDLLQLSELMRVAVSHLRAEAERWENVRECLRMVASTIPLVDRTAPTRLAAALMAAETPGVPLDGQEVRCTVSTHEGWSTLVAQPALHAQEMASAMDSLAALCPHLREAGLEGLLGWVEDSIVLLVATRRRLQGQP